jgi:hypothetical protein
VEETVPGRASRRGRSVHVSHSCFAGFIFGRDPACNFLLKRRCCHFAQVIGVTSDPRITFPYLLKICASKRGLCAAPAGSSMATTSLNVPPSSSASVF